MNAKHVFIWTLSGGARMSAVNNDVSLDQSLQRLVVRHPSRAARARVRVASGATRASDGFSPARGRRATASIAAMPIRRMAEGQYIRPSARGTTINRNVFEINT